MQVVASVAEPLLYIYTLISSDYISNQHFFDKNRIFGQAFHVKILCFKIVMSMRFGIDQGLPFG